MSHATLSSGPISPRRPRARGFTLMELMVTIAVLALLVAIGVPTFRDATLGSRLSAAANNLLASVQLARSEAIKRNQPITLCASSDGATCAGTGDWEQGWIVVDGAANVVQHQQALPAGYRVLQAGGTAPLAFQPIGIGATAANFTICRDDPIGRQERLMSLSAAGSAYVSRSTSGSCP